MEEDQKILHTEDINWYEEDENRLDYDLAFNGKSYKNTDNQEAANKKEAKVDVKKLIKKRDEKWEHRLEKARKEAFENGRKQGFKEGHAEAEKKIDSKVQQLEELVAKAHENWTGRQRLLNPGLLDLVFDMVEKIVGLPVENPQIRKQLEEKLSVLLHETEDDIKPQLFVSEQDFRFVEELVEKYAPELSLSIRVSEDCNPGEFELETQKETVVHRFREKLADLKDNLILPSWK
jgi:flagellar biosynthesis/type III secretory pathway protein FliH